MYYTKHLYHELYEKKLRHPHIYTQTHTYKNAKYVPQSPTKLIFSVKENTEKFRIFLVITTLFKQCKKCLKSQACQNKFQPFKKNYKADLLVP